MPGEGNAAKAERYGTEPGPSYTDAHRGIRAPPTSAIIEHGCLTEAIQGALFDVDPVWTEHARLLPDQ
ncbi:MAG: hypothetical protein L0I76_33925, partial [Pseudonocardia sp.]|nr:hypothetical protein [Pseudonocardia sp.]